MADLLHKTKGLVLKTVKYRETSVIVSIYTELLGLQSYLVNGVRSVSKKGGSKAGFFQPGALLELVVYHNEFKQLNRIKEYKWAVIHSNLLTDVLKNGVTLYMTELLTRCLKEPENNPDLFAFIEDSWQHLNDCTDSVMANFPVFFAVHLPVFFGFVPKYPVAGHHEEGALLLDLQEGIFTADLPAHPFYLEARYARVVDELLRVRHPGELAEIQSNAHARSKILEAMEQYYSLHIQDFGRLKSLPVLKEILR
ncbi:DNA repair protein RecO [Niabella ginsenosidivorans]|uniref:DNA repair protein RecO n=1 Tax=Niabella ginsenosidivorans TaxID=1176587 RepID=A0A1A9I8E3_9BACT|nr:DNA repair protein RecO [Niabella ginsenosidivorans]ANH82804.1 DNA repair protein RecO [Niabella ginsenosidivorans]